MAERVVAASRGTAIAAHRAGAALWPENSPTAFRNAAAMDVDFIEFDVHRTRDGVLVVHHDPALGRTADGQGAISDMAWAELRSVPLRGAADERIPLLTAVLLHFDGSPIRPRLELKADAKGARYPGIEAEVMTVLRANGLGERTVVTSFDPDYLVAAKAAGARDLIWLLKQELCAELVADPDSLCRRAVASGIGELAVRGVDASPELVAACRARGVVLGAYAGKDMDFERLLTIGISAFTSDRPDLAVAARQRLGATPAG